MAPPPTDTTPQAPADAAAQPEVLVRMVGAAGTEIDRFRIPQSALLWPVLTERALPLASACKGKGICTACTVTQVDGADDALQPPSDEETRRLHKQRKPDHQRLACLCRVQGDVTLRVDYW
ncbi:MAG: 2Fe-2S iron-sulfur cluster-binding protein [Myxococcota bacterium]